MTTRGRSHDASGATGLSRRRANGWFRRRAGRGRDEGFTLVELLIVVTITPLIVGALSLGLISVFSLQSNASGRLEDSADAQIVTANYVQDTQSALFVTTSSAATQCGSGTQLLGLELGNTNVNGQIGGVVSYVEQLQTGSTYNLVRNYCASTSTLASPTSSVVAYDILAPGPCTLISPPSCQALPLAYAGSAPVSISNGWTTTTGITNVVFSIYEPESKYNYTLSSTPAAGSSSTAGQLGGPTNGPSCGFALPNTGDYASNLCFVGFGSYNGINPVALAESSSSKCTNGTRGTQVTAAIPGGYTMTFCFTITLGNSSDQINAITTPIGPPSNGFGFLGNDINGTPYYAGIGCASSTPPISNGKVTSSCIDPAIFQETNGANDTATLSNILVYDPQGTIATGYQIITSDAETVDYGGGNSYIKWTSNLPLNLLPDYANTLGDACNSVPNADMNNLAGWSIDNGNSTINIGGTNYTGSLVDNGGTGVGTDSVTCKSNWQTGTYAPARTGAAVLAVAPPVVNGSTEQVTISAQLQGEGFNAVAFGILLSG